MGNLLKGRHIYVSKYLMAPRNHSRRAHEVQLNDFHEIHQKVQEMRIFVGSNLEGRTWA
jgi:GTP-dependent phosphoenolpyruvate carboxykinase